jgi:poly(3-hydroxyalkanoate) depolymerase
MATGSDPFAATGLPDTHLSVCGQQIRYDVRQGATGSPPLVLCCGIGASFDVFQPFVDALPPEVTVIRFDVPGVGGSPVAAFPHGFPQLAFMLARILDQLGHREVDVLGFSWGGALAQQFAMQHPGRCRRLVLVSTATGMLMVPGHPRVLLRMATPRRFHDPDYAAAVAPFIYGGSARRHRGELHDIMDVQRAVSGPRRGYLHQLAAGAVWTSLPFLRLIRQPTLVMGGDDDPIVPLVNARIMARLIPDGRLHVFHGGHVELITEAARFADVITDFLNQH